MEEDGMGDATIRHRLLHTSGQAPKLTSDLPLLGSRTSTKQQGLANYAAEDRVGTHTNAGNDDQKPSCHTNGLFTKNGLADAAASCALAENVARLIVFWVHHLTTNRR